MTAPLLEEDLCKRTFVLALKDALNVVSGKWKLAIVCTMLSGPKSFTHIERLLPELSARMLVRELRELELNGVVERLAPEGTASRFGKYALTPSGRGLESVIVMMATWGQDHRKLAASAPNGVLRSEALPR